MTVTDIVITALRAAPAVTAKASTRIYAGRAPQEAPYPHVVVLKTTEREPYALGGATGVRDARVVVMCRAEGHLVTELLGDDVIAALKDFAGDGFTVQRDVVDRIDAVDADNKAFFMRTIGFVVWY